MSQDNKYGETGPGATKKANIRVSALPPDVQASAAKLDRNRDGALGVSELGFAIQGMDRNKKTNRNLKKTICVFVFLIVVLIGCIFASSITAANLSKDINVSSDDGFAYVKGSESNQVMKTGEALVTMQGASVGLLSDDELLQLSQLVLNGGGLKFTVYGYSRTDTLLLQVIGGTITYDNIGIIDATGDARALLEHSHGPFDAPGIDGRRRLQTATNNGIVDNDNTFVFRTARMVGGLNVEKSTRYPWFTQVMSVTDEGGLSVCGGALIAPDLVLTAAHCKDPKAVHPGRHDLDQSSEEKIDVLSFERHPEMEGERSAADYDIMIIQLAESSTRKPVRLNFNNDFPVDGGDGGNSGESLAMLGFGSTLGGAATGEANAATDMPKILQRADTVFVPNDICEVAHDPETGDRYGVSDTNTIVGPHWLCTTGPATDSELTTSTCFGDSGGPILKENYFRDANTSNGETNDLLLGVIHGTSGFCGNKQLPLWNQRVSYHKDWIVGVGCELSTAPPAEWNCDNGVAPESNSVYFAQSSLQI